ncbi:MAG: flavodoxin-dependent (E)-4-hydroxy-3-methylbut-2-enyl-diphosphate synthase [Bacillota bacterium]|nr:flavodoxin-dependent (E)-4-hydroxy-3-methylbut-2-enyl-diphosphate synthase [Bacillota bacterium]
MRRITKKIMLGNIPVGGGAPVSVQTMTKTDTRDISSTVAQIRELEQLGCDIIRVAVPDQEAARAIKKIKEQIRVPLVADIHFDHRLALLAVENGADGLRINPGNIGSQERVRAVVKAAVEKNIPIRIGVNAGSLASEILAKYGRTAIGLVESALSHVALLERENYYNLKISVKAADVPLTVEAYRILSKRVDYPLHLGVTEAGGPWAGTIKSAVGIGTLLAEGIGDTIRVSLTGTPHEEVRVGAQILKSLGLGREGIEIISCPTCGRCQINLVEIARAVEERLPASTKPLRVAVMGCTVNGPGEAREADVGIAGGKGSGFLFKKGKLIRKVPEEKLVEALITEIKEILED